MTRKQLETRRQRLRELAERDRLNRCPICKTALPRGSAFVYSTPETGMRSYCSLACLQDAEGR